MFSRGIGMFIEAGGWGMFPTLLFGFFLVASAALYLFRPRAGGLRLPGALLALTFGAGLLGTLVGVVNTLRWSTSAPEAERAQVLVMGVAESANCLVLAFILALLAGVLVTVGVARAPRQT
jgi:hypothetical protein